MAWISVHTSTDGPKLRDLRKKLKCSKAEAVGFLVYLWWWGLENAEKDGRILHADKEDIEECLGGAVVGSKLSAPQIVNAFIETGWIDSTAKGYYIHDWESWQQQWYKAKERRDNDAQRKRDERKKKAEAREQVKESEKETDDNEVNEISLIPGFPSELQTPPPLPEELKYSSGFEQFYDTYPRKIGKGEAYKKYKARKNDGYSDSELIEAAKNYALQCKKLKTEKQFIKHPKTFLSDALPFLDFLPKSEQPAFEPEQTTGNPFEQWGDKS